MNLFHNNFFAMNTRMDVVMWGHNTSVQEKVYNKIKSITHELEHILSKFDSNSETYGLNQIAFREETQVSEYLFRILEKCQALSFLSNGYFDVTYNSKNGIKLNSKNHSVRFLSMDVNLDFGAIGKGIALQEISNIFEEFNVENALVSFGGSSVISRGRHPHGEYWPFAFQHENGIAEKLQLKNDCLSVSGLHNGTAHILNPKTRKKHLSNKSVCVVCENPIDAEALSTTLIVAPAEQHDQILLNFDVKRILYNTIESSSL